MAREPLLRGFTDCWVIDEVPVKADAIVVLGGGANTRTLEAANAYDKGLAGKILIPRVVLRPIEELGIVPSHTALCRKVVRARGVPDEAIELIGQDVSSTWEEAGALKKWVEASGATDILIPTEFIYTRRVRWVMDRTFKDTATRVTVMAIDPVDYERESWWSDEDGLINVQNEVLKYVFYRLKY